MNATKITTVRKNCRNHLQIDLAEQDAAKGVELEAAGGKFYGGGCFLFDLTYMSAEKIERIKAIANGGAQ